MKFDEMLCWEFSSQTTRLVVQMNGLMVLGQAIALHCTTALRCMHGV